MKLASFEVLMQLLRDRTIFLTEIEQQKNLDKKIVVQNWIPRKDNILSVLM